MFLRSLLDRNPQFVQAAVELHQAGRIPANSCVLDLDTVESNTAVVCRRARRLGLTVYAMTKQVGRAPGALSAMAAGGADGFVAVDMACARPIVSNGHRLGHLGHLVQVPRAEAAEAADMAPDYWTVFSANKAAEAAAAARARGRLQRLLVRVFGPGDQFYPGHEGGVPVEDLPAMIDRIAALDGAEFAGLTTFPALLFDAASGGARVTPNVSTLARAAEIARRHPACPENLQVNAPGTTSTEVLGLLAGSGATQVEPGHGLSTRCRISPSSPPCSTSARWPTSTRECRSASEGGCTSTRCSATTRCEWSLPMIRRRSRRTRCLSTCPIPPRSTTTPGCIPPRGGRWPRARRCSSASGSRPSSPGRSSLA